MATVTLNGVTADADLYGNSTVYSTAKETLGGVSGGGNVSAALGQRFTSPNYQCNEFFVAFDTSSIGSGAIILTATLSLLIAGDSSTTDFVAEARLYDWGTTVDGADWLPGSTLASYPLLCTYDTSTGTTGRKSFTEVALAANINLTGSTRFVVVSDRQRTGVTPTTDEYLTVSTANSAGSEPRLVITYIPASTDEILNPASDVTINSWTTDSGATTDLYAAIDEGTASDTDYIQSPVAPTVAQYYETALETHADPLSSTGHIVHYRYEKNVAGGNAGLAVVLFQGAGLGELLTTNQTELETNTTGWAGFSHSTLTRTTGQAHIGSASLQHTQTGTGNGTFSTPTGTAGFSVIPGELYSASGYSKAATATQNWGIEIDWYNSGGSNVGGSARGFATNTTSGWTQFSTTGVAPATAATAAVWVVSTSVGVPDLEVHYFDTFSASRLSIADWAHTNIPNTWTQQDQTLSGPEADSITDYSDLRLRFTPSTTTSDVVPTYVADRASANSNATVTTVDLVLTSLTVGNYLIVRAAADNSGGAGAARSFTPSNFSGTAMGTHTEYQQNNDPGAASAGVTCNVSVIKIAATSGTIRLTYSGAVVQACVAEEWTGIDATTPVVGTPVQANGVASTNLASLTDSITLGNVIYGVEAVEGPSTDTYTQDADTTNGTWTTFNTAKLGTTNATADTNMTIYGGYKAVTAAGTQTYNPTINTAVDSAGIFLELAAAPATIKTQVSWANLELPAGATLTPHYAGINVGVNWQVDGALSVGASDAG